MGIKSSMLKPGNECVGRSLKRVYVVSRSTKGRKENFANRKPTVGRQLDRTIMGKREGERERQRERERKRKVVSSSRRVGVLTYIMASIHTLDAVGHQYDARPWWHFALTIAPMRCCPISHRCRGL